MDFLKDFNAIKRDDSIAFKAPTPTFWISTGNYVINKIISGRYNGGIAQGRLAKLAGPSSAGKSFLTANIIKAAQKQDCGILIIDSENALDDEFISNVGADPTDDYYIYRGVSTINQATKELSGFIRAYRKHKETKKFLIVIDSLDALSTDSALAAYEKGETKGDQGQQAKQLKAFLSPYMHDIKDLNIAILCTKQVYQEQDPMLQKNPVTAWKMTEAIKYPFSQIALVTRLLLKNDETKIYEGIKLKVFGQKTRFTKPFQQAMIEVPYDIGIDPFSGLLEVAESLGVVTRKAAWYSYKDDKFQSSTFHKFQDKILEDLIKLEGNIINVKDDNELFLSEEDKED